jgi:hypothetical protein
MFTTEGPTCSTNSVKSGSPRTTGCALCAMVTPGTQQATAPSNVAAPTKETAHFFNAIFNIGTSLDLKSYKHIQDRWCLK